MAGLKLEAAAETFPLENVFRISRGSRSETRVVTVKLTQNGVSGRGEATPYGRYGETVEGVLEAIEATASLLNSTSMPFDLQAMLPAGAARNALDCALHDLRARQKGVRVTQMLSLPPVTAQETAVTISIGSPEAMAKSAALYAAHPLLKVKLDEHKIQERIEAIRQTSPQNKIIIDPNESWTLDILKHHAAFFSAMNISLLEQPLPAGKDEGIAECSGSIPVCADESCHTAADLPDLVGKYQVINIKLDKTGGLTEAIQLKKAAVSMGFDIMVGCMIGSSLAMAPAMLVTSGASFVDLDGPLLIKEDRVGGLTFNTGIIEPPTQDFWG